MNKRSFVAVMVLTMLQAGCNSDDDEPPAPEATDASGIWQGEASFGGQAMEFSGVVTQERDGRFIDGFGTQYIIDNVAGEDGEITIAFSAMTRPGLAFMDGSTTTTGTLTGTVDERSMLEGNYTIASGESGTVSMTYNPIYERDSSLDKLTGPWDEPLGIQVYDPDGSFFQQDAFGCVYQGRASILNPNYNVYRMTMTVSSCDETDGEYTGLGVLIDFQATEDLFIVQLNSDTVVVNTMMTRL